MVESTVLKIVKGHLVAQCSAIDSDIVAARTLRGQCFGIGQQPDVDRFDVYSTHVLIRDTTTRDLMGCFRFSLLKPSEVPSCYSAQHYDLSSLALHASQMMEIGRFCIANGRRDPDILRLAWAMIAQIVLRSDVDFLFGCSSFEGTDPGRYRAGFGLLQSRYLAPPIWRPGKKSDTSRVVALSAKRCKPS